MFFEKSLYLKHGIFILENDKKYFSFFPFSYEYSINPYEYPENPYE